MNFFYLLEWIEQDARHFLGSAIFAIIITEFIVRLVKIIISPLKPREKEECQCHNCENYRNEA